MSISNVDIQKAFRIKRAVNEFFETSTETKIQAKDLMKKFIVNEIFKSDHKEGLPIREFLRHLDDNNHLKLIAKAYYEQKEKNKNWYFIKSLN